MAKAAGHVNVARKIEAVTFLFKVATTRIKDK